MNEGDNGCTGHHLNVIARACDDPLGYHIYLAPTRDSIGAPGSSPSINVRKAYVAEVLLIKLELIFLHHNTIMIQPAGSSFPLLQQLCTGEKGHNHCNHSCIVSMLQVICRAIGDRGLVIVQKTTAQLQAMIMIPLFTSHYYTC
jgi:hypothetical protein